MVTHLRTIGLVLMLAATVRGGGVLELVPDRPGPYEPASSVNVDVVLHNHDGRMVQPRLIGLDFSVTDPNLTVPDTFHFQLVPPLVSDAGYARFETMPKVDIACALASLVPGFILEIADEGSLFLGTVAVGMPGDVGTYILDVINADSIGTDSNARVQFGFASPDSWVPWDGSLTGGTLEMTVVPEPASLVLLALGGVGFAALRRRF